MLKKVENKKSAKQKPVVKGPRSRYENEQSVEVEGDYSGDDEPTLYIKPTQADIKWDDITGDELE